MMIRPQMLDQMIPSRKPIIIFPETIPNGTILFDWEMDTGLVAFEIGCAREGLATADAAEWTC